MLRALGGDCVAPTHCAELLDRELGKSQTQTAHRHGGGLSVAEKRERRTMERDERIGER